MHFAHGEIGDNVRLIASALGVRAAVKQHLR